jgi:hypothetical protein
VHRFPILFVSLALAAGAAAQPPDLPPAPAPLMTVPGKVLLDEPFGSNELAKTWKPYKADVQIIDGHLRVAAQPGAGHPPEVNVFATMKDVAVRFRFRLDGAKYLGLQISDVKAKHHIANVTVSSNRAALNRVTGWGPTTKAAKIDAAAFSPGKDEWHTLLLEICGNEAVVQIDDKLVLAGKADGLEADKPRLSFISGGEFAWYDDVKVWEVKPDPKWESRRAELASKKGSGK